MGVKPSPSGTKKDIPKELHKCQYCGAITTQPDKDCYKAPDPKPESAYEKILKRFREWIQEEKRSDVVFLKDLEKEFYVSEKKDIHPYSNLSFVTISEYKHGFEDCHCAHQYLDALKIDRTGVIGKYSVVGRIKQLEIKLTTENTELKAINKKMSDSYMCIRALVGAWDTKSGGIDLYDVTENCIKDLKAKLEEANKEIEKLKINKQAVTFDNGCWQMVSTDAVMEWMKKDKR